MPWLFAAAFLLAYETYALITERRTLSRMVVDATRAWGVLPFVAGIVVGMLASHFWWRWCP